MSFVKAVMCDSCGDVVSESDSDDDKWSHHLDDADCKPQVEKGEGELTHHCPTCNEGCPLRDDDDEDD